MAARLILTLVLWCAIAPAWASPYSDPTAGRAVFTGATMPSATSIDLNPAAIGLGTVNLLYVAVTGELNQYRIDTNTIDPSSGALTPGPRFRGHTLTPGANLAIIYHTPAERFSLGLEARIPPGESFPDGQDALRYHTLGGGQRDYYVSVGTSLKVLNELYIGASLAHDNTSLELHYARDTALEQGNGPGGIGSDCGGSPCGIGNPIADEHYDVNVKSPTLSTSNLRVNIGVVVHIHDIYVGVAYHTPPGLGIETSLDGTMDVRQSPRDGGGLIHGNSTVNISYPASVDSEVRARIVEDLDLHVGGRWEDLSRMQAYDVRGYDISFPANNVPEWTERPRGLHDSFALWAGVEQIDSGQWLRLGARLGAETSALPDDRTSPLTISPTSATFDVGAQFRATRLAPSLVIQLSYGIQYFPTVNVTDSAFDPRSRLACIDSNFDYSTPACAAVREGYAIPTAAGDYGRIEHAVRIGLRFALP